MKKEKQLQYVKEKLAYFYVYIKMNNYNSFTDINIIAEGFLMNLLNIVFSLKLENLNKMKKNFPGVDLGDFSQKVAFQITSRSDYKKIEDTYEKIYKNYKNIGVIANTFSKRICFLVMDIKCPKFKKNTLERIRIKSQGRFQEDDIINFSDLICDINSLYDMDYNRFKQVYDLISNNIDSLPPVETDKIIIEEILTCFNRPAFTAAFRDECNLKDFDEAIKNTISLINTGSASDGATLANNREDVNSRKTKEKLSEIVDGLNYIRKIFSKMRERGYATECKCGNPSCKLIFNNDFEFCRMMNDLRLSILFFTKKIAKENGCTFDVYPQYGEIDKCRETEESLMDCLEKVYLYYNKNLPR